jgi:hypothetical protein
MGRILNRFRERRAERQLERGNEQRAAVLLSRAGILDAEDAGMAENAANLQIELDELRASIAGPSISAPIGPDPKSLKYIGASSSDVDSDISATSIDIDAVLQAQTEEDEFDLNDVLENTIYDLVEFDTYGLVTRKINPDEIKPIKFKEYDTNTSGVSVIDKNKSLDDFRHLLNLNTTKVSQNKFDQLIDIEFKEFTDLTKEDRLIEENRLLSEEIERLRMKNPFNLVTDTLAVNGRLYSDRTGEIGAPGYPRIENRLLSKNRKAIAIMQSDGNFVIYKGEFDIRGRDLPNSGTEPVFAKGFDNGEGNPSYFTLRYDDTVSGTVLAVGSLRLGTERWRSDVLESSPTVKVVLDDNGILSLYDKDQIIWTSFGQD